MTIHDVQDLLRHEPYVRSLARALMKSEAEDIVQQTYVRALATAEVESVRHSRAWLGTIVRNVASNLRQSRSRRTAREQRGSVAGLVPSAHEVLEREERRAALVRAVEELPAALRTIVLLRFFEDLPPRVIAKELDLSVVVVKERLRAAIRRLRTRLDHEETGDLRAWLMPLMPLVPVPSVPVASSMGLTWIVAMTTKTKLVTVAVALLFAVLASVWYDAVGVDPVAGASRHSPTHATGVGVPVAVVAGENDEDLNTPQRSGLPIDPVDPTVGSLTVRVVFGEDQSPAAFVILALSRLGGDPRVGVQMLSANENGIARFESVSAGRVMVRCNRSTKYEALDIQGGEAGQCELVLPSGVDIEGIVVDRNDDPVPGAAVHLAHNAVNGQDMSPVAMSGPDGRFSLRDCSRHCLIGARAEGYAASRLVFVYGAKGTGLDVRVILAKPGCVVEGLVVGVDGRPVADAVVRIGAGRLDAIFATSGGADAPPAQVHTDADGRFRALGIEVGEQPIVVRAPRLAPWASTCAVSEASTTSVHVVLEEGVTVRGTVRDDLGLPVERVSIRHGQEGQLESYRVRSDAKGDFVLRGLPSGELKLTASHRQLGMETTTLTGVTGGLLRWDLFLQRGIQLHGRVLGEDGEPVARVSLSIRAEQGEGVKAWYGSARSDAEGRFTAINCPAGRLLTIDVHGSNLFEMDRRTDVDPMAGEVILRGRALEPTWAHITGRVVSPKGAPIVNARVSCRRQGEGGARGAATGSDGRFRFTVQPGAFRVSVSVAGHPTLYTESCDVGADRPLDLGDLQMTVGGKISVKVTGADWESSPLTLRGTDGDWVIQTPVVEPSRVSMVVEPGSYQLSPIASGVAATIVRVVVRAGEETRLRMELQRGIKRRIEFEFGGEQGSRLRVQIRSTTAKVYDRLLGDYEMRDPKVECWLLQGQYRVTAENDRWTGAAEFGVAANAADGLLRIKMRAR